MNNDEKGMLVGVTFVLICLYTLLIFQDIAFGVDLPVVGSIGFSLKENILYFVPPTLFVGFLVFWKIRKEKENKLEA